MLSHYFIQIDCCLFVSLSVSNKRQNGGLNSYDPRESLWIVTDGQNIARKIL